MLKMNGLITDGKFLTKQTAEGLRVTLHAMKEITIDLIENHGFSYVLSGRINQDALEVRVKLLL